MPFCAKSLAPAANASLIDCRSLRPVSIRSAAARQLAAGCCGRRRCPTRHVYVEDDHVGLYLSNCSTASRRRRPSARRSPAPAFRSESMICAGRPPSGSSFQRASLAGLMFIAGLMFRWRDWFPPGRRSGQHRSAWPAGARRAASRSRVCMRPSRIVEQRGERRPPRLLTGDLNACARRRLPRGHRPEPAGASRRAIPAPWRAATGRVLGLRLAEAADGCNLLGIETGTILFALSSRIGTSSMFSTTV